jgi:hypothetical protein
MSKKEYCTYWIRTGECDYVNTGCKYKHEMPDRAKLHELGFLRTPLWWKEKTALRGPTWMQQRMNKAVDDDNTDDDEDSNQDHSTGLLPRLRELLAADAKEINQERSRGKESTHRRESFEVTDSGVSYLASSSEGFISVPNLIDLDTPGPPPSLAHGTADSGSATLTDSGSDSSQYAPHHGIQQEASMLLPGLDQGSLPRPKTEHPKLSGDLPAQRSTSEHHNPPPSVSAVSTSTIELPPRKAAVLPTRAIVAQSTYVRTDDSLGLVPRGPSKYRRSQDARISWRSTSQKKPGPKGGLSASKHALDDRAAVNVSQPESHQQEQLYNAPPPKHALIDGSAVSVSHKESPKQEQRYYVPPQKQFTKFTRTHGHSRQRQGTMHQQTAPKVLLI